jgi:guanosine-3',5'-bis(diphosphate) 3'-pyrophosphohydrolase
MLPAGRAPGAVPDAERMGADDVGMTAIFDALRFAAVRHSRQRRKDVDGTPYINHPIAVVDTLWRVGGLRHVPTLVAGILHDTVEDTDTTPQELRSLFGEEVAAIVLEVTDDKALPKAERKRLQVEHAPRKSGPAKCVKLADKICNLRDVVHNPPSNWSHERRREYLDWAERVVAGLRGASPPLEELFGRLLREGRELLDPAGAPAGE